MYTHAQIVGRPAIEMTSDIVAAGERYGRQYEAAAALHGADQLLAYIVRFSARSKATGPEGGVSEYFEIGKRDAEQVRQAMSRLDIAPDAKVLEFASGYGRVSRHLKSLDLTCADIHSDAVEFLQTEIGVRAVQSSQEPERFNPSGGGYDFIFVLSFFSHLPDGLFGRWLNQLSSLLNPNGKLLFTTHGESAAERDPGFRQALDAGTGYGYLPGSDQPHLDSAVYGSSVVTPAYVIPRIIKSRAPVLKSFIAGQWWQVQYEWVVAPTL